MLLSTSITHKNCNNYCSWHSPALGFLTLVKGRVTCSISDTRPTCIMTERAFAPSGQFSVSSTLHTAKIEKCCVSTVYQILGFKSPTHSLGRIHGCCCCSQTIKDLLSNRSKAVDFDQCCHFNRVWIQMIQRLF